MHRGSGGWLVVSLSIVDRRFQVHEFCKIFLGVAGQRGVGYFGSVCYGNESTRFLGDLVAMRLRGSLPRGAAEATPLRIRFPGENRSPKAPEQQAARPAQLFEQVRSFLNFQLEINHVHR